MQEAGVTDGGLVGGLLAFGIFPQITATTGIGSCRNQEPGTSFWSPMWAQWLRLVSHLVLLSLQRQGPGSEVEQMGIIPAPIWNAGTAG